MNLLELTFHVKRGKNRQKVFLELDKPMMPSELVKKIYGKSSNTYFNLVSRALMELKELKLVVLANPKEKTGRIYKRTNFGEKVARELRTLG